MEKEQTLQPTVEIFKTNVTDLVTAETCIRLLSHHFPGISIHFDLEDCDHILRVEGYEINTHKIIDLLRSIQLHCSLFPE
ncbi:hypothetical protein [Sinomicrobium weinanense]|uniref:Uncharacterized protein n=1 Tax=Sinomicrobium weinanense TaxID=2842200 RepID=A0A926JNB7_9FLAO|nr:hypothetical protein [Sinomicrobium weinanense]MBC9794460.1 hypothetical protein [Sinomicrobium weinanense]MBU3124367.1 hypothetical protein [Sinomicrobium weinanense]